MTSAEARKLDILLGLKKKGYNLTVDENKAEIMTMSLGGGYTLECNVKNPPAKWKIIFNDDIETTEYPADSEKVVFTYRKDSDQLIREYNASLKDIENPADAKREEAVPSKKKKAPIKNKARAETQGRPGMMLPIVYPSEMQGSFMQFRQWTADNNVIPKNSEVVILDEDEYNFKVVIPQAHLSFDIQKDKAGVVLAEEMGV